MAGWMLVAAVYKMSTDDEGQNRTEQTNSVGARV
jgi:hypothetical protein